MSNLKEFFNTYKIALIAGIVCLLIGRYAFQPKVKTEIKETVRYVEVFKEVKDEKKNVKTVIVEKINKDGSKETRTEISDNSETKTETNKKIDFESEKKKTVTKGSGVSLALLAIKDVTNLSSGLEYGVVVSAPVFGSVSTTALVTTEKQVGLGLGITF